MALGVPGKNVALTGPLAGIEFPSYRAYLDAKATLKLTGEKVEPSSREYRGAFQAEVIERRFVRQENIRSISGLRLQQNKEYMATRAAEKIAGEILSRNPIARPNVDEIKRDIMDDPRSRFNRMWRKAEAEGFAGGKGRAFDDLMRYSGMRAGEDDADRNRYIKEIRWYMTKGRLAGEKWVNRNRSGKFETRKTA